LLFELLSMRLLHFTPFCAERPFSQSMQAIEKMERETGIEPATSSLGNYEPFDSKELSKVTSHLPRPLRCT